MKKLLTICLMLLGVVAQAQNFAITATTEAAVRKNIVKGNAANYGFGVINDTLKLIGLTTRNVIFTGSISKSGIGLGNVDNTSDANKPVSTATQTALNLKANLASPAFTGTVSGITKTMVGLGNVDNTTDVSKPISTATQTALDLKLTSTTAASTYLPITNPTATGTLTAPTIANSLGATFATSSGNVGIGTASPSTKLSISGTVGINTVSQSLILNNATGVYSTFQYNGTSVGDIGTSNQALSSGGTNDFAFTSRTGNLVFGTGSVEKMRIFNNGRVGINTTTDEGYLVNVNGTTNSSYLRVVNSADFAGINPLVFSYNGVQDIWSKGTNGQIRIVNNAYDNINFALNQAGDGYFRGKVGIGTTAPTSKLQVVDLPVYATNAAAVTAGLTAGAFYRTSVGVLMVVY